MYVKIFGAMVLLATALPGMAATFQSANVHDFATGQDVGGAGTMVREEDGVEVRLAMTGLRSNNAYSVWWIVFNNPEMCVGGIGGCGLADLNPMSESNSAVINAAGFVTGPAGSANVTAELEVGPTPAGIANPFGNLESSTSAEIHMIIQFHGKPLVGSVNEQITSAGAACNPNCGDDQAIAFLPVP